MFKRIVIHTALNCKYVEVELESGTAMIRLQDGKAHYKECEISKEQFAEAKRLSKRDGEWQNWKSPEAQEIDNRNADAIRNDGITNYTPRVTYSSVSDKEY